MRKAGLDNFPHGEVDAILTSPPYSSTVSDGKEGPLVGGDDEKYGRWTQLRNAVTLSMVNPVRSRRFRTQKARREKGQRHTFNRC